MANHLDARSFSDHEQSYPMNSFDGSERPFRAPENQEFLNKNTSEHNAEQVKDPSQWKPTTPAPKASILSIWWPEFIACFLFVGSFGALVGTLFHYDNEPMPRWPYGLSINTLISIYVTIFDMALMFIVSSSMGQLKYLWFQSTRKLSDLQVFDEGARGPWGALIFLCVLRLRHVAASIGALIIILALFVAPFSQQLVKYHSCLRIDMSAPALISRTNIVSSTGGQRAGAMMSNMDLAAQAAMYAGLFNDKRASVTPTCPTGNCTFTSGYASAGYCSRCTDFTGKVESREMDNMTSAQNISVQGWDLESDGYRLGFVLGPAKEAGRGGGIRMVYGTGNDTTRKEAADKCEGGLAASNWTCLGFGAAECTLAPCVRRYWGHVAEGNFTESILSTSMEWGVGNDGGTRFSTVDMTCVTPSEREYLRDQKYVFDDSTEWLPYNLSLGIFSDQYNETHAANLRDECIYQGLLVDSNTIQGYLNTFFEGYIFDKIRAGDGTSIAGRALFNMGNTNFSFIEDRFDRLATSMTVYARNRIPLEANANFTAPVQGYARRETSCVGVQLYWLTLQAAVVTLTIGFFAATLWMLGRSGDERIRNDFKTSVTPLLFLFHDVGGPVQRLSAAYSNNSVDDIRKRAEKMHVALVRDERGWGFKNQS